MFDEIKKQVSDAVNELIEKSNIGNGNILVIGCSSSEVTGNVIGHASSPEVASAIADAVMPILKKHNIAIAAQCCEHLNRALIIERETAEKNGLEIVNVRPVPKAGGSFATAIYERLSDPVAVEYIKADAGLDIGSTLIGMHLKSVAVPLRLSVTHIGEAYITAARTRAKFIGGSRANYVE